MHPRGTWSARGVHRLPPPPVLPRSPARIPFPLIAVIAPLVGAIVIGLVTGSPFVLVFALLSPVIAVATMLDARRVARREHRAEAQRFDRECRAFESAIIRAHDLERHEADTHHAVSVGAEGAARQNLRIGTAPRPSAVAPEATLVAGDSPDEHRLHELLARARVNPALPVVVPRGRIVLNGDGLVADALERRLSLEPHVELVRGASLQKSTPDDVTLRVVSATRLEVHVPGHGAVTARPEFVSRVHLDAERAAREATSPVTPPVVVRWRDLDSQPAGSLVDRDRTGTSSRSIAFGHDGRAVVRLDLESDGPHALIGGTTGSGKSELLRALALGWAAQHGPHEVQLLFVDFKGGATFAGLTDLPHAVGLVTDLNPTVAERAVQSLRAELRRRERALGEAGVRDLKQRPELCARLIVMVDEFAALSEAFPEVNAVFADISARGRSLGVHLVLCTQHPSAVVRDAVAANCAVRIAFRMSDSAGASFLSAHGRELSTAPPGRAVLVTAEGAHVVQVATIDDSDIEAVRARWATAQSGRRPWLPPLPATIRRIDLEPRGARAHTYVLDHDSPAPLREAALRPLTFGLLDDPAEQRQYPATWWPRRDGALAVIGAPRSGRSTALAALATAARESGAGALILPRTVVEAWAVLDQVAEHPTENTIMIADDLDYVVAASDDLAPEFLSKWDAASRALRRIGGGVAASIGALSSSKSMISGRFESRLILRCLDADDHQLAGAPRGMFDRTAPAGRGWWADRQVQVVFESADALDVATMPAPYWEPPRAGDSIVVTRDVDSVMSRLAAAYPHQTVIANLLGEHDVVATGPRIFVADPEGWQSAWSLLSSLRRTSPVVCIGIEPSDVRSLLGVRSVVPPIDARAGEVWACEPGGPLRRRRIAA